MEQQMRGIVVRSGRNGGTGPPVRALTRDGSRALIMAAVAVAVSAASLTTPFAQVAEAAPAASAPTFAADYLDGMSGPRPAKTVSLAGTWDFTPVTNTVCTGGGPFGTTTGPMTCVDSPASGQRTTIQVPGG